MTLWWKDFAVYFKMKSSFYIKNSHICVLLQLGLATACGCGLACSKNYNSGHFSHSLSHLSTC